VFGYFRHHSEQSVLVLGNFSDADQAISGTRLRQLGMRKTFTDIIAGKTVTATHQLVLEPYQFSVLVGVR
jgi:amylosucrase